MTTTTTTAPAPTTPPQEAKEMAKADAHMAWLTETEQMSDLFALALAATS